MKRKELENLVKKETRFSEWVIQFIAVVIMFGASLITGMGFMLGWSEYTLLVWGLLAFSSYYLDQKIEFLIITRVINKELRKK